MVLIVWVYHMRPTLTQLECLVTVAEERHFTRAAARCYLTQPALSARIRALEKILGVTLFERGRRRQVVATPAGKEAVARARAVLAAVDDLVVAARALRNPLAGPLRLGVIPTVAPWLLPRVLPEVRRRHPELRLLLHEGQTADLVERLLDGRLDLLLLALEAELGGAATLPLFRDDFLLAVSEGHPLARRRRVRVEDLAAGEILLLEDGHCLRDQALAVCQEVGAAEAGDFRAASLATLGQMVAGGLGTTLLPAMAVPHLAGPGTGLWTIPFRKPAPGRTIGLAWRPGSPREAGFRQLGEALLEGQAGGAHARS